MAKDYVITLARLQLYNSLIESFARELVDGVLYTKTSSVWKVDGVIVPKGKLAIESDTGKIKIGDGSHTFKDLAYINLTPNEVNALISAASHSHSNKVILDATTASFTTALLNKLNGLSNYSLPKATSAVLGGVKVGTNITVSDGLISVPNGTTSVKGVVQLTDSVSSTSTTTAATPSSVKVAYDKAIAALPQAGGSMKGMLKLFSTPTDPLHAATKEYVDSTISKGLATFEGMVLRGTIGTGGTLTAVPTTEIVKGDTYKIITNGTYAGYSCKVGDMLIAMITGAGEANTTNWVCVPSGNETETFLKYATSGVNLTTSAKSGTITLGEAAIKQIASTIDGSVNLPTAAAVKSFVEGKGYLTAHPSVAKLVDSSSTSNPGASGTFSVIDSVIRDTFGHVTKINTKTVTMPPIPSNVASATKMQNKRLLDGINFDGTTNVTHYGICSTAATTAAKVVDIPNFSLVVGACVTIKFTVANTASAPTLNVSGTGAKPIFYCGSQLDGGYLGANKTYEFRYNGTQYEYVGDLNTNTTYTAGTGLVLSGTQFKHSNSITAGTASGDTNKTLVFGGTFTVPSITYDAQGHITGKGSTVMTMPPTPTAVSGNAGSATKLLNARNFSITGGATAAAVSFNGTGNVAMNVTSLDATKLDLKSGDRLILQCII